MKRKKVQQKPKTSTKVKALLIILFPFVFIAFGICIGFFINSCLHETLEEISVTVLFTLLVGIIYVLMLIKLIRSKDNFDERSATFKYYINGILLSLMFTLIITAITVFTLQSGDGVINYIIGFSIFPLIGIISTPNIIKYAKKDVRNWKNIFYKNGNLESIKSSKDYYYVETPVSFEKKVLHAVYKEQLLNILVVIGFMLFIIYLAIHHMVTDQSYTDNVVTNLMQTRANRSFGFVFFLMLLFLSFGIPIVLYYITNALEKIKVVRRHEYIAYHAIVSGVRNNKITIFDGNKRFNYNYCTCVGIKEKDIHFTPATLIFVPDDLLLFPDNEKFKVEKRKKIK